MPFRFQRLEIPDVILVSAKQFVDDRGYFLESYKQSDFADNGIPWVFVQDNRSHSTRHVLRGLHYQIQPRAQGKLVAVLSGEIFDVAVDIRQGSPTFGHWVSATLSADRFNMLYAPVGFAHGFCVLSEQADVLYKVTAEYAADLDRGIRWDDPQIGVDWPIANPILSEKDAALPLLHDAENNFRFEQR
jgi:dTDP-4-dehydrorhamnose 3,5-epimerase